MHAGNWRTISSTLAGCGARTLTVFLTDGASAARAIASGGEPSSSAGDMESPFSMEQFALAMLRVGSRTDHVGACISPACPAVCCLLGLAS